MITFRDTEVEKHKFDQCKNPIWICDVDTDRIVVSNKVLFLLVEKVLNNSLGKKMVMKNLWPCVWSFQKWVHIEEIWWN